ncbi:hypothetical protein GCM10027514_45410 [Azotobacter armeniacus]
MAAKKPPVTTPLHLLQQLSQSMLVHLEEACAQALQDAEKVLAKQEKRRGKAQEKLHEACTKRQDAALAGKAKVQAKAQQAIDELESLLDDLQARQTETRDYISRLREDTRKALELAQGVGEAAAEALSAPQEAPVPAAEKPKARAASTTAAKAAGATQARAPASRAKSDASKEAAPKEPAAKPAPRKPAVRLGRSTAAAKATPATATASAPSVKDEPDAS